MRDDMVRLEDENGEGLYVRPSHVSAIYRAGEHTYVRIGQDGSMGSFSFVRPVRGTPDDVRGALYGKGAPK